MEEPRARAMTTTAPRCAVVFKAYAWDEFVERQARRLAEAAGALDFYISIDETGGPAGPIPFERVVRFTCADLAAAGLPMRFESGAVLWWNPDYAHYQFRDQHPDYDYYLFVEYDCVVQCSLPQFVASAASQDADLVALPILQTLDQWYWRPYQRDVYPAGEARLALLNVCFLSSRALALLHQRRLEMKSDPSVRAWPSSEVFVATEVVRAGMNWLSLAGFGDVSHYDWFPPTLEEDLAPAAGDTFLHPVLDRRRYLASMLLNAGSLPPGELDRALSRFPREQYAKLVWPALRNRVQRHIRHRLVGWRDRLSTLKQLSSRKRSVVKRATCCFLNR
jgi:hypothetical protein